MKLSPPGSSSDLDAAREAAQRLNRVATPPEPSRPLPPYSPVGGFRTAEPTRPAPVPPPALAAPPLPKSPVEAPPPTALWQRHPEPPPLPRRAVDPEPEPAAVSEPPTADEPPPTAIEDTVDETVEPDDAPAPPSEVEEPEPPAVPFAAAPPAAVAPAEIIEESLGIAEAPAAGAATLSWSEVTRSCLVLAEAKGALLIAPDGKVTAIAGDWPPPGAEAIASRLVPAMDKALKDAPTRSVSVPLGGLHLTAWRVPVETGGLMTVGFVADTPLRPDLRPGIDAELKKGTPD
jgi:hypothetical protein